jgi:hypothetical protein
MKRRLSIGLLGVVMIVGAALPLPANDQAERACLKCKVKGLVGAMRAGDVDRAMSYLAEGFELRDAAGGRRFDREAMPGILQWDAALNSKLAFSDLEWEGDTVRGEFSETNDLLDLLGIESRRFTIEFRFSGDLIRQQVNDVPPGDGPSVEQALEPFLEWAKANHADELEAIYPDGQWVYRAAAAKRWVELLGAWRAGWEVASAGATVPAP